MLGELESEVMEIMWKLENASVRDVLDKLKKQRKIAYTTIMTVMGRLAKKRILKRKLNLSGSYIYTPAQNKKDFSVSKSKRLIKNLINEFGETAVAQFIDAVEDSNSKDLSEWQKKLKKIK